MKITYTTDDGREFDNEKDAKSHEEGLHLFAHFLERFRASDNTKQSIYKLLKEDGINILKEESETPKKEELQLGGNPEYYPVAGYAKYDIKGWIVIFHMSPAGIMSFQEANLYAAQNYAKLCEVYDQVLRTWVYRGTYGEVLEFLETTAGQYDEVLNRREFPAIIGRLNREYYQC